ncbi:MAG: ribbon-helix-helix domain-containing protein [Methylocystis sp.]|nr:ribbon-helix-helix domain-containing protein [Methylocystis sp.]
MTLDRAPPGAQKESEPEKGSPSKEASANVRVVKHSIIIAGHRTSVSLEDAFWRALKDIAAAEGVSLAALVARVDAGRGEANLSSALRVFVLERALRQ